MKKSFMLVFFTTLIFSVMGIQAAFSNSPKITQGPVISYAAGARAMKIWVKTYKKVTVQVEYSETDDFANSLISRSVKARRWKDFTAIIKVKDLKLSTLYFYRILLNGKVKSDVYEFMTRPGDRESKTFSFAVLSDFSRLNAPVDATVAEFNPNFLIFLGDLDHRDPQTLKKMRRMHRHHRGDAPAGEDYRQYLMHLPSFHVWDDHDFGENDADKYFPGKQDALRAFREYFIVPAYQSQDGIWHSFLYAQAEFFMLDLRSQRDPADMIDGLYKSMLGNDQKAWLKTKLINSTAQWKFLMSTVPFNKGTKPTDAWAAYITERQEIIDFIRDNQITGVIVISGDIHSGGAIDDGTNSDFPEISVPHANMHPNKCTTTSATDRGQWSEGLICGVDNPGFAFITVTPENVLLNVVGEDGTVRMPFIVEE